MPVKTDSQAWENGEVPALERALIIAFLSEHPQQAYNIQEICDAALGTELLNELMAGEVGPEDLGESDGQATFKLATLFDTMTKAELLLQDLEREGLVESRIIDDGSDANVGPPGQYYTIAETGGGSGD
jgi:DNA-binding PadR family transcriptional regulator